jgi:hypothetical protein
MVKYTNPELIDMVLIYWEALSNADATRRLYVKSTQVAKDHLSFATAFFQYF